MDKKEEQFIRSLIDLTNNNLLDWVKVRNYLDTNYNRVLENLLVSRVQYNYEHDKGPKLDVDKSYVVNIEGSYVYIFNFDSYIKEDYTIYIQNDETTDINELKVNSSDLFKELVNKVIENLDNIDKTIDKVINIAELRLNN